MTTTTRLWKIRTDDETYFVRLAVDERPVRMPVGTLTNCPHTGNPAHWGTVSWNGTNYCIPLFALT